MAEKNTGNRGIQSSAQYISSPYTRSFREKDVPYNLKASKIVIQSKYQSTTDGLNSSTYLGAKLWNSLPEHIKGAATVGQFQSFINALVVNSYFMSFICKYGFNCTALYCVIETCMYFISKYGFNCTVSYIVSEIIAPCCLMFTVNQI